MPMGHPQVSVVPLHSTGWLSRGNHEEEMDVLTVEVGDIITLAKSTGSAYGESMAFR
ncbi:hypothetical protein YTPLAS72_03240 [Nitrospira sp.]|nr:hypothetical protein YTPLAS72_03240 [Nitrospira sp.]